MQLLLELTGKKRASLEFLIFLNYLFQIFVDQVLIKCIADFRRCTLRQTYILFHFIIILIKSQQAIVDVANNTVDQFKEEFNEVYNKMNVVGNSIRDLSNQIREIQKQIKRIELFGEGIQFEKSRCITLKHNYEPRVVSLKLIEVSKSGKKATAVFEWEKGRESREEGVNVEKIIYQVI